MSTLLASNEFRAELPGWMLRGVLCAANSAFGAFLLGFQSPAEVVGMVVGVGCWIGCFAAVCASSPVLDWLRQPRLGAALKRAAWIKIGLTVAGSGIMATPGFVRLEFLQWLAIFGILDMWLGIAALWLVARIGDFADIEDIARLDSVGWTALTTLIEGALMAALIGSIALAVLLWWRWRGAAQSKFPIASA
jgi:hypothetical protein